MHSIHNLGRDVRQATRALRASPWYSATVVGVIGLSIALAAGVFAIVDGALFKPLPFRDAHQLHFVQPGFLDESARGRPSVSLDELDAWQAAMPDVRFTALSVSKQSGLETTNDGPLGVAFVRPDFFEVLGASPVMGHLTPEDYAESTGTISILISHELWQRRFAGDRSVVGRMLDGPRPSIRLRIAGVMPPDFVVPGVDRVELLAAPLGFASRRKDRLYSAIVRLPDGVSPSVFHARLERVMRTLAEGQPLSPDGRRFLGPFDKATVTPLAVHMTSPSAPLFRAVFAGALLLALVGCLNVAGLTASRLLDRSRDIALRRALGASSFDITRGLVIEQSLLLLTGAGVALVIAMPLLHAATRVLPPELYLFKTPAVDLRAMTFVLGATTVAIALTCWWPIRRALRTPPGVIAHLTASASSPRRSIGAKLVIASQTTGVTVLVVGGSLLVGSLLRVWSNPPGLATDNLLLADIAIAPDGRSASGDSTPGVASKLDRLIQDVTAITGVESAGAVDVNVLERSWVTVVGFRPMTQPVSDLKALLLGVPVTPGFFAASGIRVLEGRVPTDSELAAGAPVVAVSRLYASHHWPNQSALGQQLRPYIGPRELPPHAVVGVVDDVRFGGWDLEAEAAVYGPYATLNYSEYPVLFIRTHGNMGRLAEAVLRAAERHAPAIRVTRAATAGAMLADTIRPRRLSAWLFGMFAAAGLVIVAAGLLGVAATSVARRTREIGIRMALGATREGLVRRFVWDHLGPALLGLAAGGAIAAWAVQFVRTYLYELTTYDVRVWLAAIILVVVTSVVGALIPSLRASRVDPVKALRAE